jgi:hypothetical protein
MGIESRETREWPLSSLQLLTTTSHLLFYILLCLLACHFQYLFINSFKVCLINFQSLTNNLSAKILPHHTTCVSWAKFNRSVYNYYHYYYRFKTLSTLLNYFRQIQNVTITIFISARRRKSIWTQNEMVQIFFALINLLNSIFYLDI